jgi:hypothetical protein
MTRRAQAFVAAVVCVAALAFAAGGSASAARQQAAAPKSAVAQPATAAAVTKFLLHAGITYYVFDHYIYKPYKAGELHGFTHVVKIAEAAAAALVIYHEAKLMIADVKDSKLLSFLATPITVVVAKLSSLKSAISGGHLAAIGGVSSELGSIQSQAAKKGIDIKEIVHAL